MNANAKKLTVGGVVTLSLAVLVSTAWLYSSKSGVADAENPIQVYVTKGAKLKGEGYAQVTLDIDKKKGVTTIGEKVNSAPKKVGSEE